MNLICSILVPFNSRPHTEVDQKPCTIIRSHDTFNSRPHTEVDALSFQYRNTEKIFQLTTSHGGRHYRRSSRVIRRIFQLTTSHGGRPQIVRQLLLIHVFQLTTSHGGRPAWCPQRWCSRPFNSRPHTEVDNFTISHSISAGSFNSRPHTEVDNNTTLMIGTPTLSTHDLTRRSTQKFLNHQIPRSSFNSRPHTEVDQ